MPSAISLFAGAGGLDLAVAQEGFDLRASVEFDPFACETLRENHLRRDEETAVYEADVRALEPRRLRDHLDSDELDLLIGGPPCQPFSQIGKRQGVGDDRGALVFEMVRYARALEPRVVVMEEVKGIVTAADASGKRGGLLESLVRRFQRLGYTCHWQVLNAVSFGVPQNRERVLFVALRDDDSFEFPEPTHAAPNVDSDLLPFTTVGEVIQDLHTPVPKGSVIPDDSHLDVTPAGDRRRINGVPQGDWLSRQFHLPESQRGRLGKKDTTKFRRLAFDLPSNTLRCGEIFFHPTLDRYLTPREYMRIHGYPDDYVLRGPIRGRSGQAKNLDQHRQIANSVPPALGRAVLGELAAVAA